ncbi:MAG: diguanylate cyclase, partial [Gammaproteobacteria bacterium]|nr:diguanylate cyclase [Gammaproteobacteria bacterium]
MTPFWHPSRVMVSFFLTLGLLGAVTLAFWLYVRAEQGITLALEERHASLTLAAELRQSSEALTRMARSYTVTGNPVFKDLYQNILDIREGNQPRPGQFADISWDLASAGRATPPATGPRVPLLDLIRQTGLPEVEYRLLEAAKTASDQLTAREFQAMALMETGGSDAQADREAARNLLFDATYYQAKADILQLIQAFITRVDQRTAERVKTAVAQAAFMRHVSIACGLALVLMLGLTWAALG